MNKLLPLIILFVAIYWWTKNPSLDVESGSGSVEYVIEYTADGKDRERLPMLVALHGNGDSPENFFETALDLVHEPARIILLKGPLSYRGGDAWPSTGAELADHGSAVHEALVQLTEKYPTLGRPVLLGFSGGASMAYYQAIRHGMDYSLIIPVSGTLTMGLGPEAPDAPGAEVIAFHGRIDSVIPFVEGDLATSILKEHGVDVTFEEFGGQHLGLFTTMKETITEVIEQGLRETLSR